MEFSFGRCGQNPKFLKASWQFLWWTPYSPVGCPKKHSNVPLTSYDRNQDASNGLFSERGQMMVEKGMI